MGRCSGYELAILNWIWQLYPLVTLVFYIRIQIYLRPMQKLPETSTVYFLTYTLHFPRYSQLDLVVPSRYHVLFWSEVCYKLYTITITLAIALYVGFHVCLVFQSAWPIVDWQVTMNGPFGRSALGVKPSNEIGCLDPNFKVFSLRIFVVGEQADWAWEWAICQSVDVWYLYKCKMNDKFGMILIVWGKLV